MTVSDWRDRFRLPVVGFPAWSPAEPQRLVFVSDEGGSTQIWTTDLALGATPGQPSGRRRPVTDQRVGVEELVLSPRGDAAAWWSDDSGDGHGAWVATNLADATTAPLLTGLAAGWSEGLAWCGDTVAIALTDDTTYRVYVGTPGADGRLVAESPRPMGLGRAWETSPGGLSTDGALLCLRHSDAGDMLHFGLRVIDSTSAQVLGELVDPGLDVRVASWSPVPGDQQVALIHERDGIDRPAVWRPATGQRRDYPLDLPGEVDVAGWYPDASALLLVHWHDGRSQLYRLDLASGGCTLVHDPEGSISGAGVRPDGTIWLREEAGDRPPRIRTTGGEVVLPVPRSSAAPSTLSSALSPAPPPGPKSRSLRFVGSSGQTCHMLVATPPNPGPHPTVMLVHGGPEWADSDAYDPWTATLVDHGVAVAKVNYRGSTGFGVPWRTTIHDGNIGIPEVTDVVDGLRYLTDIGVADPARSAIEGWSWGGYVALLAIGLHADTFAAAIGGIPVCDSVMTHEDCSPSQQMYDRAIMGGTPDEVPERYAERSPSTYLDAVRTPVLLIAGEHDSACPIRQVRWYADELTARGGSVRLHVYDAGHHANSVAEKITQAELELDFLAAHGLVPARTPR